MLLLTKLHRTAKLLLSLFLILSTVICQAQLLSFVKGADGSVLDQVEQSGGKFYNHGVETDAYEILKKYGFNNIRLKLWHTPSEPYNDLGRVKAMAKRANDLGLGITLDFHYSDTWADPANQQKPEVWNQLQFSILTDSIRQYTRNVIGQLKLQNTLPEYIQIGNEISCGMLWNDGNVCNPDSPEQWNKLGILIKNAIQGVNEALSTDDKVKIIIHFDNGGNNGACRWFYDNITEEGIDFDIIGLSFYPWWHGTLTNLRNNLNDLATRYEKDIIVVEFGYPWTLAWNDNTNNLVGLEDQLHDGYPATVEGQYTYIRDLIELVKATSGNHGTGVMYWSPEWIVAPTFGSPWENVALFDFNNEVLESIRAFEDNAGATENQYKDPVMLNVFPNPFQEETNISFDLSQHQLIKLSLMNLYGEPVINLHHGNLNKGNHKFSLNNEGLSSGLYIIRLSCEQFAVEQKIILID